MTDPTVSHIPHAGEEPPPVVVPPASAAAQLIDSGATPVHPDVKALQDQITRLEAMYAKMAAERGIPLDPVAEGVRNLGDHIEARTAALPSVDTTALRKAMAALTAKAANPDTALTSDDLTPVKLAFDDFEGWHQRYEMHYIAQLLRDLHRAVLGID